MIYFLTEEGEEAMLVTEDIGVEEEVIDDTADVADIPEWVLKGDSVINGWDSKVLK